VHTSFSGGTARLAVVDTGRGVADENKDSIFDKYKRMENGGATKGTGLGLTISQGIVNARGCHIFEKCAQVNSSFILEARQRNANHSARYLPPKSYLHARLQYLER